MVDDIEDTADIHVTFGLVDNPRTGVSDLICRPMVVHVKTGDKIIFRSEMGTPFSVISKGQSPLEQVEIRSTKEKGPVEVYVRSDAVPGVYSFACALLSPDNEIYLDAGCPDFIVDPRGRGTQ